MGTHGVVKIGRKCALEVYRNGHLLHRHVAGWFKNHYSGVYNGISSTKPRNMMNGPSDLAVRMTVGLQQSIVASNKKYMRSDISPDDPLSNPEVGALYMIDDPELVEVKRCLHYIDVQIEKPADTMIEQPYEVKVFVDNHPAMTVEEFIKFSETYYP